jgi:hypothetical protein
MKTYLIAAIAALALLAAGGCTGHPETQIPLSAWQAALLRGSPYASRTATMPPGSYTGNADDPTPTSPGDNGGSGAVWEWYHGQGYAGY